MAKLDISPETDVIESLVQRSASLREMLAELFDNAFDQDATRIEVQLGDDGLTIEDNGKGIASWAALLKLGRHHSTKGRAVGRYGVGFKHAAIWLAEAVDIETRHNNARSFTRIDWSAIQESRDWNVETGDPVRNPGPPYTRLQFTGIRGRRLKNLPAAARELAYRFTPALQNGAEIIVCGERLEPLGLPPLMGDPVVIEGYLNETQHYRLTAGIKADHAEPERAGYDVAYLHRILRQRDMSGTGTYSPQRFYGYLELFDDGEADWTLAEHKDDFEERDQLYEELFPAIEPLLLLAQTASEQMEFRDLQREVNERFSSFHPQRAREKRQPGDDTGTHSATGTGRKRSRAKDSTPQEDGTIETRLQKRGIYVSFDYLVPGRIGEVQGNRSALRVALNPEFSIIRSKNPDAVAAIVCALLVLDTRWMNEHRMAFLPGMDPEEDRPKLGDFSELIEKVVPYGTLADEATAK
jgi:hypothetical protein